MKIINLILITLLLTVSVSAIPTLMSDNQFGRNLYFISNVTKICFTGGANCINATTNFTSSGGSGSTYFAGIGLILTADTFSVNNTYLQIYNETSLLNAINTSLQSLTVMEAANNATQASQIANEVALQLANNNTQASQIAAEVALQAANNATQATLISNEVALQLANNNSQAALIATLRADNTTQASQINTKLTATADTCGVGNVSKFDGANFDCVDSGSGGSSYSAGLGLNLTGTVFNINLSYFLTQFYSITQIDTLAGLLQTNITTIDTREAANNVTQEARIVLGFNNDSAINARWESSNSTQAGLIVHLFNANTTLWNRQSADNSTLTATKAGIANCAAGTFVNGTTSTGVLCGTPAGGSGGGDPTNAAGWTNSSIITTITNLNVNITGNLSVIGGNDLTGKLSYNGTETVLQMRSKDNTLWSCVVSNAGVFSCA